jgi:peptidoglycan/LPS O-acetylase OafA/YrhL
MHAFNVAAWNQESFGSPITGLFWLWIAGFLYYRYRRSPLGFCILAFPCVLAFSFGRSVGFPCFATIFALVLCEDFKFSEKIMNFFDFLGDLSYPIYLFHVAVMALMVFLGFQGLFVFALGVLGVSALSLYLVDYPARKIFRRFQVQAMKSPPQG